MMKTFTRKQKKELMDKLLIYLSKKLTGLKESGELLHGETAAKCGLHLTRVCEIAGGKYLSEKGLVGLVSGGIVDIKELIEKCRLSTDEAKYINENFAIYEDQDMVKLINFAKERGLNPKKILADALAGTFEKGKK